MGIIKCPECGGKVSTTLSACPHCGFKIEQEKNENEKVVDKKYSKQTKPQKTTKMSNSNTKYKKIVLVSISSFLTIVILSLVIIIPLVRNRKIEFGFYPQTEVIDSTLISALSNIAGEPDYSSWEKGYEHKDVCRSNNLYIDIDYNNSKYRGIYTKYNDFSTGYEKGNVYWFKFEPIEWRVIKTKNGNKLLLSDIILDASHFNYTNYNNYENSCVRNWLNETFYSTAFTSSEMDKILTTNVDNSVESTGYTNNHYTCPNTNDKLFLLSSKELKYCSKRILKNVELSDYAKTRVSSKGGWWLRSPNAGSMEFGCIVRDGIKDRGPFVSGELGMRVACWVNL